MEHVLDNDKVAKNLGLDRAWILGIMYYYYPAKGA